MTTETAEKVTEATRYDFMGEEFEIPAKIGYELAARYREAALALHAAKARAFEVEEEIKCIMQGYESLTVNGEKVFTWRWGMKTEFLKRDLHNKYPEIHDEFVKKTPHGVRTFKAPGVTGVN